MYCVHLQPENVEHLFQEKMINHKKNSTYFLVEIIFQRIVSFTVKYVFKQIHLLASFSSRNLSMTSHLSNLWCQQEIIRK